MLTGLHLSNLHLHLTFDNGSSQDFLQADFTLAADGLSFNGKPIAIGGTNPLPTSATLTGLFSSTTIDVSGMGIQTILPNFSAQILQARGAHSTIPTWPLSMRRLE